MTEPLAISFATRRAWAMPRCYTRALQELRRRHPEEYQELLELEKAAAEAEVVTEHLAYLDGLREPPPTGGCPACPACGRQFAVAGRTQRFPLHGRTDSRCPGSGRAVAEEDWRP